MMNWPDTRIAKVEAIRVQVPLSTPYVISRGRMNYFDNVIVRLITADGTVTYGESVPLSIVGDARRMAYVVNGPLADLLVGRDAFDLEAIIEDCLPIVGADVDIIAGIDLALWDRIGHQLDMPVWRLLGGAAQPQVAVDYTISAADPSTMADKAVEMWECGFRGVVVKVDCLSAELDGARVKAVRSAFPADGTVRVDCNAGYRRDDAFAFLDGIANEDIEFVEQPVARDDLEGMRMCRARGLRISADESLDTPADALALVGASACDVFNVKVPKVGGLLLAKRIAAIAAAAGLPVVVGGRTTLGLSRCASRHFAVSTPAARGHAHEGPGPASQALVADVVAVPTSYGQVGENAGFVLPDEGAGLGAVVLPERIEQFRVS